MYYKLIGCKVFEREIASVSYNCKNMLDVSLIRQSVHEKPKQLHALLQEEIDRIDRNEDNHSQNTEIVDYDAILLTYGLCTGVSMGLKSEKYPIVIPRVHDCVAMLMGSREMYKDYYFKNPGTFYSSCGFTELAYFKNEEQEQRAMEKCLRRYKGNQKLAEKAYAMEKSFTENYERISFIRWPSLNFPEYEERNRLDAQKRGWQFEILPGSDTILRKLVDGDWDEDLFLVVPPGRTATESYEEDIMKLK